MTIEKIKVYKRLPGGFHYIIVKGGCHFFGRSYIVAYNKLYE